MRKGTNQHKNPSSNNNKPRKERDIMNVVRTLKVKMLKKFKVGMWGSKRIMKTLLYKSLIIEGLRKVRGKEACVYI